jgi:6-phosphogluconolactonase/glucosamine-6-phosphate isomerase/deaminase
VTPDITVLPDLEAISHEAARWVVVGAREAALFTGRCAIALSGGSTPGRLYELLASEQYRDVVPWDVIEWYWGDERCVPPDHEASNYRLAWDLMLSKAPVPESSTFRMPGEARDHARAARRYENLLRDRLPDLAFDLVLLGIGSDGHTASQHGAERARTTGAPYQGAQGQRVTRSAVGHAPAAGARAEHPGAGGRGIETTDRRGGSGRPRRRGSAVSDRSGEDVGAPHLARG